MEVLFDFPTLLLTTVKDNWDKGKREIELLQQYVMSY